jgi:hypothetical protein
MRISFRAVPGSAWPAGPGEVFGLTEAGRAWIGLLVAAAALAGLLGAFFSTTSVSGNAAREAIGRLPR